ncbi:MAG: hypothetical protein R6T93_13645 [Trueperaceae bacterium]
MRRSVGRTSLARERRRRGGAARRSTLALALLAVLLTGCDDALLGITWVRSDSHVVVDGARQAGALLITGGDVSLAPGSRTDGPVLLLGGELTIDGLVMGDVLAPGGALRLGPWAVIRGDLGAGAAFERHPDALIDGEVTVGLGLPSGAVEPRGGGWWWRVLLQALATGALAAAWARWAPRRLAAMADAAGPHFPVAASLGVLVFLLGSIAAVIMAFTIVLIPATLLVLVLGVVAVGTGWGALGFAIARAIARARSLAGGPLATWAGRPVWLAAFGGFDVALLLGIVERVPWVGGGVALVVSLAGLGAVALTGVGGRPFVHAGDALAAGDA